MNFEPRNTTIDCSRCGSKVQVMAVRIHRCDKCGLVLDRDYNSAIEIKNRGLQLLGVPQGLRELTPVGDPNGVDEAERGYRTCSVVSSLRC